MKVEKLGYLPALDGLRGIAIILVLLTHANFQLGHNGIIGVHIFFALSGFLITTLILEEKHTTGNFSFFRFYKRRFLRLIPALVSLLIIVLLYAVIFQEGSQKNSLIEEIIASLFYFYNIMWIWDIGKETTLLAHSWSLSVEEQFYLVWPAFLILFQEKLKKWQFILTMFFLLVGSMVVKHIGVVGLIYNSLIHEAIFFGCLAGLTRFFYPNLYFDWRLGSILLVFIAFIGIFPSSFVQVYLTESFVGIFGILTSLIILGLFSLPSNLLTTHLSNPLLVFIGKISYSLYLWHVPIFKWFKQYSIFEPWVSFFLKFLITFLLATFSWRVLEVKFRIR
ncbi:acyltransferase [Algoriphagus lacus]|uniref:Acyltransferase n=1 Tax=Algoriphagus lacus TaxID=2056311 RepID=A0A418PMJ1_9BACT|nr:acyltransferase [Algoriphagus lacus]RIW12282.1 acyltransferase [Algoriphagus lacus]